MTSQEVRALDFVRSFIARRGFSPSLDEVAHHLGLAGRSSGWRIVASLVEQGALIRVRGHRRNLRLADQPTLAGVSTAALLAELARRPMATSAAANLGDRL